MCEEADFGRTELERELHLNAASAQELRQHHVQRTTHTVESCRRTVALVLRCFDAHAIQLEGHGARWRVSRATSAILRRREAVVGGVCTVVEDTTYTSVALHEGISRLGNSRELDGSQNAARSDIGRESDCLVCAVVRAERQRRHLGSGARLICARQDNERVDDRSGQAARDCPFDVVIAGQLVGFVTAVGVIASSAAGSGAARGTRPTIAA